MSSVNFSDEVAALSRDTRVLLGTVFRGIEKLELLAPLTDAEATALKDRKRDALAAIEKSLENCTRCSLHVGRTRIVVAGGDPNAALFIALDCPDADEDKRGQPAASDSGDLLTKMLGAMGLRRDDVFLVNIVRCRPPKDRKPDAEELDACFEFVKKQIDLVKPRALLAMGETAARALGRTEAALSHLRGKWHDHLGIPLLPTWSPQALLENAALKKEAWDDLKKMIRLLEEKSR